MRYFKDNTSFNIQIIRKHSPGTRTSRFMHTDTPPYRQSFFFLNSAFLHVLTDSNVHVGTITFVRF